MFIVLAEPDIYFCIKTMKVANTMRHHSFLFYGEPQCGINFGNTAFTFMCAYVPYDIFIVSDVYKASQMLASK